MAEAVGRCRVEGSPLLRLGRHRPRRPSPGGSQLLIRRNRSTGELAYYRCYSPVAVPLAELVRVAGSRWRVEEFFQSGKGLAALDEHQVRRYASWSRWVTLAMLAHAFLAVIRADEHARQPASNGLIPLTCNEIQRLFIALVIRPVHDAAHQLGWTLGARKDLEHLRLRAWAHMLGFRGHFSTKSRRYSTTLGALRDTRAEWRRAQAAAAAASSQPDTTYVLAHWVFAGTGFSAAETWLAASLEPAPGTEGKPAYG